MSIMILVFFLLLIILLIGAIVTVLVMQQRSGGSSPSPSGERPIIRAESLESSHTTVSLKPKSGGTSRDETAASGSIDSTSSSSDRLIENTVLPCT